MDFSPEERRTIFGDPERHREVIERLEAVFRETPLDIVAEVLLLEELPASEADEDEVYQHARRLSHSFRDGLLAFFFDSESELDVLTRNYGVF
jgi:hypothetical protein